MVYTHTPRSRLLPYLQNSRRFLVVAPLLDSVTKYIYNEREQQQSACTYCNLSVIIAVENVSFAVYRMGVEKLKEKYIYSAIQLSHSMRE